MRIENRLGPAWLGVTNAVAPPDGQISNTTGHRVAPRMPDVSGCALER